MRISFLIFATALASGCAGMKKSGTAVTGHAESFNILFFQIPNGDTVGRAEAQIPPNTKVHTMVSTPDDLDSIVGIFNRIFGVSHTQISGTLATAQNKKTPGEIGSR